MASEVLAVPEEDLLEVIEIIRAGLKAKKRVTPGVRHNLKKWCDEEEVYIRELGDETEE